MRNRFIFVTAIAVFAIESIATAQKIRPESLGSESLFLIGSNGNSLELKPGSIATSFSLTMPDADGASGQVLQTNGSGVLSWTSSATSGVPSGAVITFAGSTCPAGYIEADGKSYPQSGIYSALASAIGTANGDGSTGASGDTGCPAASGCFNVPDYRGRFLRGVDGSAGRDPGSRTAMATGGNTGNAVGSVQTDAVKAHGHAISGYTGGGSAQMPGNAGSAATMGAAPGVGGFSYYTNAPNGGNPYIQQTGTESRPINAYVNYCIKI